MGLMEAPSPADILRQQALQAIKDSPEGGTAVGPGGNAPFANPMSPITTPGGNNSKPVSPKAMSPRARPGRTGSRGKSRDKMLWRNKTWTGEAQDDDAYTELIQGLAIRLVEDEATVA